MLMGSSQEAMKMRKRAGMVADTARKAVESGGSSNANLLEIELDKMKKALFSINEKSRELYIYIYIYISVILYNRLQVLQQLLHRYQEKITS